MQSTLIVHNANSYNTLGPLLSPMTQVHWYMRFCVLHFTLDTVSDRIFHMQHNNLLYTSLHGGHFSDSVTLSWDALFIIYLLIFNSHIWVVSALVGLLVWAMIEKLSEKLVPLQTGNNIFPLIYFLQICFHTYLMLHSSPGKLLIYNANNNMLVLLKFSLFWVYFYLILLDC